MSVLGRKKTACYVLGEAGLILAQKLGQGVHIYVLERLEQALLGHSAYEENNGYETFSFTHLPKLLAQTFSAYDAHIFFCAAGIAVRCIAPHIIHKKQDPAVVVCDEKGNFAISLLSGHWGEGNTLATELAHYLQATPVITTASDVHAKPAVDVLAKENGCSILDWDKVKICNAALLEDKKVQLYDPIGLFKNASQKYFTLVDIEKNSELPRINSKEPAVAVHWRKFPEHENILRLTVPALHMGIGCKKGTKENVILEAIERCLQETHLEKKALLCLASVDKKQEEQGLLDAAQALQLPIKFYNAEILAQAPSVSPSSMAAQLFGFEGISVSEGAALTSAEDAGRLFDAKKHDSFLGEVHCNTVELIVPKMKFFGQVTVAIAVAEYFMPQ